MNGLLALSLSNSFTKAGAMAAFVALVGIALLSLLVFSQAREIKRLRDWAGRAPERAAERDQRISAEAASRTGRPTPPAPAARVIPRATPLVSAPVSSAVASAATAATSVSPAAEPASGQAREGEEPVVEDAPATGDATAAQLDQGGAMTVGGPAEGESSAAPNEAGGDASDAGDPPAKTGEGASETGDAPAKTGDAPSETGEGASETGDAPSEAPSEDSPGPPDALQADEAAHSENGMPAPVTAAAKASGSPARPTFPPSPGSPAPPAARVPAVEAAGGPGRVASPAQGAPRAAPLRAGGPATARPARTRTAGGAAPSARGLGGGGPKYYKRERSPARAPMLIVGGVVLAVVLLVLLLSVLKGGGSHRTASTGPSTTEAPSGASTGASGQGTGRGARAESPASLMVTVLNGTSTAGLAHHLAADLQQSGYAQASASAGVPPGTHSRTVVEYKSGHRADAARVARALNVADVQPIDGTVSSMAGSATVVVLAGVDQAALLGGAGAQSKGEPAVGSGEATPAAGQ